MINLKNFFYRLKAEIKAHLTNNTSLVCGAYELETIDMFLDAFDNAILLEESEEQPISNKAHIKGTYYDGFKNGMRTAKWRYDKMRAEWICNKIKAEIEQLRLHKAQFLTNDNKICIDSQEVLDIIDKYKAESEGI